MFYKSIPVALPLLLPCPIPYPIPFFHPRECKVLHRGSSKTLISFGEGPRPSPTENTKFLSQKINFPSCWQWSSSNSCEYSQDPGSNFQRASKIKKGPSVMFTGLTCCFLPLKLVQWQDLLSMFASFLELNEMICAINIALSRCWIRAHPCLLQPCMQTAAHRKAWTWSSDGKVNSYQGNLSFSNQLLGTWSKSHHAWEPG